MEINHPNAQPLTEQQKAVLEHFHKRLSSMVSSHGLTEADVNELIREVRGHPLISTELMQEVRTEVRRLLPGQGFTFDWD